MAKVIILGGGVSGHTAASFLNKKLGKEHEVVVVTPNAQWNWIPSNIWVGVGKMKKEQVIFPLSPVYQKAGITYKQAKALSIHPDGKSDSENAYVTVELTDDTNAGKIEEITYDYIINATGPKLNFDATPGLGNGSNGLGEHTVSVCTADHAVHAASELDKLIEQMKQGEEKTLIVGTGHGMCTCQGAAFEYIFNIEHKLNEEKVRDKARLIWISNEYEAGDFGMGGMHVDQGGYQTSSKVFTESIMATRGLEWITRAHVSKIEAGKLEYEQLDGSTHSQEFDFAMLIPPFGGVGLKAYDKAGEDITSKIFAPNGFMKVDADYSGKPYEEWKASDWPSTLQNPDYSNMFAVGIAFAPPHLISKPMKSTNGTPINPTPPRTGMPSAIMGKAVAISICDMILKGAKEPTHKASMSSMGAACVASTGNSMWTGTAVSMTVYPVVPDYEKYPETGRDQTLTFGEVGLAGHWVKTLLHHMFLYKAKLKPGWFLIPE